MVGRRGPRTLRCYTALAAEETGTTDGGHSPRSRPEAAAVPPDAGEASGCRQHLASSGGALQPSVEDPWEREGVEEQAEQEQRQRLR